MDDDTLRNADHQHPHRENHGNDGLHNLGKGREFQPNEGKQGVKQDNADQAQAHQRGKAIAGDSKFQEQRRHCQNAAANQRRNPPRAEKMKKGFHFGNSKQRIVSRPMPLFAQQRCARFYPVVYHIIPKKTSRPGGGGL